MCPLESGLRNSRLNGEGLDPSPLYITANAEPFYMTQALFSKSST